MVTETLIGTPPMSMIMPMRRGLDSRSVAIQTVFNKSSEIEKCCVQHKLTTRIDCNTP